jgi:PhzF family phenazine biosynthesis protein
MSIPFFQVDAFADRPFGGNPAAVCMLDRPAQDRWLQAVAQEMNLSETAFLWTEPVAPRFRLRWFTPVVEVDLCGHATLAAAHVLWSEIGRPRTELISFDTRSGRLACKRDGERIRLDFPRLEVEPADAPSGLLDALGLEGAAVNSVHRTRFDWFVEVVGEQVVRGLKPDFAGLARVKARGTIVTAPADGTDADFVSRFFAPASGVDEDPVTGSAHCALAPFWAGRLGRLQLVGVQLSARGGTVHVELAGDRVLLGGRAVTVVRGTLECDPTDSKVGEP